MSYRDEIMWRSPIVPHYTVDCFHAENEILRSILEEYDSVKYWIQRLDDKDIFIGEIKHINEMRKAIKNKLKLMKLKE